MSRIKASILILVLIVAPVASLCGAHADASTQCGAFCPMHGGMYTTDEQQPQGTDCHHGKSAKQDCLMKSGCGHTVDLGLASPWHPAVLRLPVELLVPVTHGTIRSTNAVDSLAGFRNPPFQPPRT